LNDPNRQDYFQLLPGIEASTDSRGCLVINSTYLEIGTIITNDIVSLISNDKFRWIGRYDRVINSGGLKISPEKIERSVEIVFNELSIKRRFFIAGISDAKFGEQVTLLIEGTALDHMEEENIKIQLVQRLDKYEVPKAVLYVLNFTETATQKIDRLNTLKLVQKK
jgi:O-succinylbenzoic acid--CoA ligase